VVTPGDAESIAQALLQLAHTPRERARLGAMARQAVLQWEKEIVLNDFERKLKLLGGECRL
jgi:glycosyltransferase involved in cell wall biosynthesis